jgi:hypothetical protein
VNDRDKAQTQDLYSDIMLNHHLSQKLKLIGKIKFNHLIIKKKILAQNVRTRLHLHCSVICTEALQFLDSLDQIEVYVSFNMSNMCIQIEVWKSLLISLFIFLFLVRCFILYTSSVLRSALCFQ